MEWNKPSEELGELLQKVVTGPEIEKKKMFGCPCYFINGNMAFGVYSTFLFFRLDEITRKDLFLGKGRPFEPQAGRIMKEYVQFSQHGLPTEEQLQEILNISISYTKSLPVKIKK